jgi:hypothetical protein
VKKTYLVLVLVLCCAPVLGAIGCKDLLPATPTTVSAVTTTTVATTYAIGDTGPAGGIIFYDKGDDTGGWRYLEVAPASTEWQGPWGQAGVDLPGADGTAIGTGKQNTADIVAAQGTGDTFAAQLCDGLVYGGCDDWFLPSKDEQDLLYRNLYLNGLGGFQPGKYWGSYEPDAEIAWTERFENAEQYYGFYKDVTTWVRAVRSF